MSYIEQKAARDRAFIESIHGGAGEIVRCLPPIQVAQYDPRPSLLVPDDEPREIGWSHSYTIENGAELLGLAPPSNPGGSTAGANRRPWGLR